MKRKIALFFIALVIPFIGLFSLASFAFAQDEDAAQNVFLRQQETVNGDYFGFGEMVTVDGTVNGDAYVAGGDVRVNGVVNGDLLIAGGNVTITGTVTGDIRGAGGNILNSARVGRNATFAGGSITFTDPGTVTGNLVVAGGNVTINAPVGGTINSASGQLSIGNRVGGTVNAYVENLVLSPQAQIAGDLNYWNERELLFNPEASISGQVNRHAPVIPQREVREEEGKILGIVTVGTLLFWLYTFIIKLLIGLIIIWLIPVFMKETTEIIGSRPLASLGIGFLAVVLFPIIVLLLFITVIGIPIAVALILGFILYWILSGVVVALFVGLKFQHYYGRQITSLYWSYLVGLIILSLLDLIPLVNFVVGLVSFLIGTGALLLQKRQLYGSFRQKKLI